MDIGSILREQEKIHAAGALQITVAKCLVGHTCTPARRNLPMQAQLMHAKPQLILVALHHYLCIKARVFCQNLGDA